MSRDVGVVIGKIIAIIPEDQIELREDLDRVISNAGYKAPEMMIEAWDDLARVLNYHLPSLPAKDWQWKVAAIIADKTVDEMKEGVEE